MHASRQDIFLRLSDRVDDCNDWGRNTLTDGLSRLGYNVDSEDWMHDLGADLQSLNQHALNARYNDALDIKGCRWLRPLLVGQFEFVEWTPDAHLRHSTFVGLREDKDPRAVVREA